MFADRTKVLVTSDLLIDKYIQAKPEESDIQTTGLCSSSLPSH